jgi:16S rRNA G966 N2-methylase RsmD
MYKASHLKDNRKLKEKIFPKKIGVSVDNIKIDTPSYKYITYANDAQEISNLIADNISTLPCPEHYSDEVWNNTSPSQKLKLLTITDITAGVGGNVINFSKHFKQVNAIEIDRIRYEYLKNNCAQYKCDNVNFYLGNSMGYYNGNPSGSLKQDVIFFDPPWGGTSYKNYKRLRLFFDGNSIESICSILLKYSIFVVIKLPINYDVGYLFEQLYHYNIICHHVNRMLLCIVSLSKN